MKKLLILSSLLLTLSVKADDTNTIHQIHVWEDFLSSATTNLIVIPYGLTSTDFKNFGGGLAVGYELSPNVVPFLRLEADKHGFYSPSGTVQLQVPIKFGLFVLIPFGYTGVSVPLGKHSADPVIGLVGMGGAIRLGAKFDLLTAYELRSDSENHLLLGVGWKPNGW